MSCHLRFAELARVADIGRGRYARGGASRPRADKPKDYEPPSMLQQFVRDHRTFAFCDGTDFALANCARQKGPCSRTSIPWRASL